MNKRKIRDIFNIIAQMLVGAIFGLCMGMIMIEGIEQDSILLSVFGFVMIIISYLIHLIIHEAGHLLFGLLTGFEFNSFRIGSWMWMKKADKIVFRKMTLKGTGGQCLMSPPRQSKAYFLYNAGGVIINLSTGLIALIAGTSLPLGYVRIGLLGFGLAGLFTGLTNGAPMIIGPIANDGYNILSIMKEPQALDAFYVQLNVASQLAEGKAIKDMPEEWFEFDENLIHNPLIGAIAYYKANQCLQNHNYEEAKRINQLMIDNDRTLKTYELNAKSDHLLIEILTTQDENIIKKYSQDKEVRQFMKSMQGCLLGYIYALKIEKNEKSIHEAKKRLDVFMKNYPYAGEIEVAKDMIESLNKSENIGE